MRHTHIAHSTIHRDLIRHIQGLAFDVIPSTFDECLDKKAFATAEAYVQRTAHEKGLEVWRRLTVNAVGASATDVDKDDRGENIRVKDMRYTHVNDDSNTVTDDTRTLVIISADTIVVNESNQAHTDNILEKPSSAENAVDTLLALAQHRTHSVMTAVCVFIGNDMRAHEDAKTTVADTPTPHSMHAFVETTHVTFGSEVDRELIDRYVATGEPMDKAGGYGYQGHASLLVESIQGCYYNVVGLPVYRLFHLLNRVL